MKIKLFTPSFILLLILFFFGTVPAIIIYTTKLKLDLFFNYSSEQYREGSFWYLLSSIIFLLNFILGLCFCFYIKKQKYTCFENKLWDTKSLSHNKEIYNLHLVLSFLGVCFTIIYFLFAGYKKIFLLGTNIQAKAFRVIGYDDTNRVLTALLEIARKVLLPQCVLYFLSYNFMMSNKTNKKFLLILFFCAILSVVSTFDRAPLLLYSILIVYYLYIFYQISFYQIFFIIAPLIIFLVGSAFTLIQYNNFYFNFSDIVGNAYRFLWLRAFIEPAIAGLEYSYCNFSIYSEKLYLEHSRLGALLGKEYIGMYHLNSKFVTPVGYIADLWRNIGMIGIIIISPILGFLWGLIDLQLRKTNLITHITLPFMTLCWGFYLIYGVFFSQGIIFQLLFIISIPSWIFFEKKIYINTL